MNGVRDFGIAAKSPNDQPQRRLTTSRWRSGLCLFPAGDGFLRQFFHPGLDRRLR
jgi:hypothetical protein